MECTGLLRTIAEDENLAGIHNGADTHGESLLGNLGFIVVEETAVGLDGVGGKGLDARSGRETATRLVESDMTVRADTTHKEVHATSLSNHLLIMGTFGQKVGSIAVEDMDILGFDVDVVEEIVPHEAVVARGGLHRGRHTRPC